LAGSRPRAVRGPAQVDGHGQRPERVLVQDQLPGRHRCERLADHQPVGAAPGPHLHRVADGQPGRLPFPPARVEGEVAEVVDRDHAPPDPARTGPHRRALEAHQPARVQLRPQLGRAGPGGQVGRGRGEHVPPVEGPRHRLQPERRVLEGVRPVRPAPRPRPPPPHTLVPPPPPAPPTAPAAHTSSPLSGPTSTCPPASTATIPRPVPTPGSTTARCTARGRYGTAWASTHAPCRTSWAPTAWVTSITRTSGATLATTPWHTPTKGSSSP